jgi:hypothetical protein
MNEILSYVDLIRQKLEPVIVKSTSSEDLAVFREVATLLIAIEESADQKKDK